MSQCIDRRFEKYLHAYELGMLTDEERSAFEIHQLECNHCFEAAANFSDTASLLRYDEEVDYELNRLEKSTSSGEDRTRISAPAASRFWRKAAYRRVVLLVAVTVVVLVLKPWRLEFETTHEAQALENRLAIMDFNDMPAVPESERLGATIAGLLMSDLSQSDYLRVVSRERLREVVRRLERGDGEDAEVKMAILAAREAGASWAIFGNIVRDGSELAVVSNLVDLTSGDIVASQRVEGRGEESLFTLVDRLTVKVKSDLELPAAAQEDQDLPVADITTHSTEAYSHYLDGLEYVSRLYLQRAVRSFEMAIELDSTFAMAYFHLSRFAPAARTRELTRKALLHSEEISRRDRLLIKFLAAAREGDRERAMSLAEGLEVLYPDDRLVPIIVGGYWRVLGDPNQAIRQYIRATRIDPLYKEAWNLLAYAYQSVGNAEMAIEVIDRYISIAPGEPNPYDSKGEICLAAGRTGQAIEAFQQARVTDPNFGPAAMALATLYLYRGEFEAAESQLSDLVAMDSSRTAGCESYSRALLLTYQGRFREAIEVLGEGTPIELTSWPVFNRRPNPALLKARIHWTRNELSQAIDVFRSIVNSGAWSRSRIPISTIGEYALLLAESGDLDRACWVVDSLSEELPDNIRPELYQAITEGCLSFAEDDLSGAIRHFRRATELSSGWFARLMLGRAYLESGRAGRAADVLESLASDYSTSRYLWDVWDAQMDYYLGVACDEAGRSEAALEALRKYLAAHEAADPGLREIEDARARVARLQSAP